MQSTEELLKRFQKRDLTSSASEPPPPPKQAQFVQIRRKNSSGLDADSKPDVSQEALVDEDGLVGLAG